jgi:hypothetical protein
MTANFKRLDSLFRPIAGARHRPSVASLLLMPVLAATLIAFGAVAHAATTSGDPMTTVKSTVGQVLEALQDKQMPSPQRQRKVLEIVAGHFDFTDMARSSLGYNWKKLSPDQQQQFVPLFTAFMEDAYINKVNDYSGQKVQYVGQTSSGDDTAEVKTGSCPPTPASSRFESITCSSRPAANGRCTMLPLTRSVSRRIIATSSIA